MTSPPRVLFVSKPISPPWNDGSKNLVRDIASHLGVSQATVFTVQGSEALPPTLHAEPLYRAPGRFRPGLAAQARVLARLVGGDPHDIWHAVFAPNPVSSSLVAAASALQRVRGWKGKTVQTVASRPASFAKVARWLTTDRVVALSAWTRDRLVRAGVASERVRVIPPCVTPLRLPSRAACAALRAQLQLGDGPVVLYPGDYEVSSGAETLVRAVPLLLRAVPEARVLFACRAKTERAAQIGTALQASMASWAHAVRFVGEVSDMPALFGISDLLVFPVDDLFGKVDLPCVLLEALAFGLPLVLASGGVLEEIPAARFVPPGDPVALADALVDLLHKRGEREGLIEQGRTLYRERFAPERVAPLYDALYAELFAAQ